MLGGKPNHNWQLCFGWDFRLYDGSDLKTYLFMTWYGHDALAVVRSTGVYLLDFFCPGIQFYVLLSPIFTLSTFHILIVYVLGVDA